MDLLTCQEEKPPFLKNGLKKSEKEFYHAVTAVPLLLSFGVSLLTFLKREKEMFLELPRYHAPVSQHSQKTTLVIGKGTGG
jgi:hypothetical protein